MIHCNIKLTISYFSHTLSLFIDLYLTLLTNILKLYSDYGNSLSLSPSTELVFEEVSNFKDPPNKPESLQAEQ